jgi:molybdate transport system regulatory protein
MPAQVGYSLIEDGGMEMRISARNVLAGTVQNVTKGAVNAEITIALQGGETVVAVITNSSTDSLGLQPGKPAYAIIKASEVMIGVGMDAARISARNVLPGVIANIVEGAVNSEVEVRLAGGTSVVASITKQSVKLLGFSPGVKVSAIIKASNVMVGV